jgi:ABC-type multidrug transport system fused ATPase/permease subunit
MTIAENIAYGDLSRTVPMNEIIQAAKDAHVHSFINNLPEVNYIYSLFSVEYKCHQIFAF